MLLTKKSRFRHRGEFCHGGVLSVPRLRTMCASDESVFKCDDAPHCCSACQSRIVLYTALCLKTKQTSPLLSLRYISYLRQISSDFSNFWQKHSTENLKQTHARRPIYVLFGVPTARCKISDASDRTLRRRPLTVCLGQTTHTATTGRLNS